MDPRFVTRTVHAYLDYPVAVSLMVLPFVLNLGSSNPLALWLAVGTGVAAFVLTLLTDHNLGVFRILPYWFHLAVDGLVGIAFLAASPIAWYAVRAWLQEFAFRTGMSLLVFLAAGLLTMVLAIVTVSWQSWRAAIRNPAESLRYE